MTRLPRGTAPRCSRIRRIKQPLQTVETITATTTTTGLTIQAVLDTRTYQRGIKITDAEMKALTARHLHRHEFHGDWNYTVCAAPVEDPTHPNEP